VAPPDYTYNFWVSTAACSDCPTSPNYPGWYGTCNAISGTSYGDPYNWGINVSDMPPTPTNFNATKFGDVTGGCLGEWWDYKIVTCLTCWPWFPLPDGPPASYVCWQIVNQSGCQNWGARPPSPPPPKKGKGHYVEEHYERSSSQEKYDRVERGGKGSGPSSEEALWSSRLPQDFATSQAVAMPQPTSTPLYFLMALTFGVVIGVGSYLATRVQKRSEYLPIRESVDKDSLLFA